jgi:two-component system chemotaxis response regulator CheB
VIRVLVVDDSAVIRRLVTTALSEDPEIEVVGTAANGNIALAKIPILKPDAMTLDIEMPELDGLGTLRAVRPLYPRLPIIMFSTLTEKGAVTTLDALTLGANDYVTKPANVGSVAESLASVREQLVPKIKALTAARRMVGQVPRRPIVPSTPPPARKGGPLEAVVLGCSTGGPDALSTVLANLPGDFPVPIFVVQHMPPLFTSIFAQRLDKASPLKVCEAQEGMRAEAGSVYVAPGDFHMQLKRDALGVTIKLDQGPQENFCRPAVDVLFRSASGVYGAKSLAVVLTGMGQDGLEGMRLLKASGAISVVQDEASSVVWGMPGAVANAGLADQILPLTDIAALVTAAVRSGRAAARV